MISKKIVFATNNAHKLSEIKAILPSDIQIMSLAEIECFVDIPETSNTIEGNALQKARYVYEHYGVDCFADDTGLEVEALNGAPGVHTARYAGEAHNTDANTDKLLSKLQGQSNRRARFRTVIALIQGGEEHTFEGIVEGYIAPERRGTDGFGYDPVFSPEETGKTFAELGVEFKNQVSHRARAVRQLVEYFNQEK